MRPFCIATIGTIIGIIMGLYLKSIALFVLVILFLIGLLILPKKYFKQIIIFLICLTIFYTYVISLENKYNNINEIYDNQEIEIHGIITSNAEEEYKTVYILKVFEIKNWQTGKIVKENIKLLCNIKKSEENIKLEYGDEVILKTTYEAPSTAKNNGGFDYSQYLKTKQITGSIDAKEVGVINKNKSNIFSTAINNLRNYIIQEVNRILQAEETGLCIALLLGEKSMLTEDIQESFRNSSLSHMLAISGAHISYILLGITKVVEFLKLHKRWSNFIIIIFLIFFMALVNFTPSVTRACIMAILNLLAQVLFRKADIYQNLAISSFIILLFNPYSLLDIGFQLSFGGTIRNSIICT